MKDKSMVMSIGHAWGTVRFPKRWWSGKNPEDVLGVREHGQEIDHWLTPGCVDLSSMDSIHALANLANDLWDDGILNDLVVEAFNPALAGKGLTLHVTVDACEDTLDHFSVHASMDDGHNTADLEDDDRLGAAWLASEQGWLDAVDFANEYFEKKKRAQPAIEGGVRYTQDASRAASIATRPGGAT
jgi:hypothetical protein